MDGGWGGVGGVQPPLALSTCGKHCPPKPPVEMGLPKKYLDTSLLSYFQDAKFDNDIKFSV